MVSLWDLQLLQSCCFPDFESSRSSQRMKKWDLHQVSEKHQLRTQPLDGYLHVACRRVNSIQGHVEGLIDKKRVDFHSVLTKSLRIILEQCVEFNSWIHLQFINCKKALDSRSRVRICRLYTWGVFQRLSRDTSRWSFCILSPVIFLPIIGSNLHAPFSEDVEGFNGLWYLPSYTSTTLMTSVCSLTENSI